MSSEQTSSVAFRVPDFIDADGISYTNIEITVVMDSDIHGAANLAKALERTIGEKGAHVKNAKRKAKRTDMTMTTEQIAQKLLKDVQAMSEQEKAKVRELLDREFKKPRFRRMEGFAEAARRCAAEEAAMAQPPITDKVQ